MKNVCEKVFYVNVKFCPPCFIYFKVKKNVLESTRVRMGRILNLLYRGGEGKESSGACEQSKGGKSR